MTPSFGDGEVILGPVANLCGVVSLERRAIAAVGDHPHLRALHINPVMLSSTLLDDWGPESLHARAGARLLEIVEALRQGLDHHHQPGSRRPLARSDRHPTLADAILDRSFTTPTASNSPARACANGRHHESTFATNASSPPSARQGRGQWRATLRRNGTRLARHCPPPPARRSKNRTSPFCRGPNPSA